MNKKDTKIKQEWLAALRSGNYKQGRECLYNPDNKSFCCLGVLEHLLLKGKVENEWSIETCAVGPGTFATLPSPEFYEQFNLHWVRESESELSDMNDHGTGGQGDSFEDIALYIEENWA